MQKEAISVHELAMQMGISLSKAYELVKRPDFPTIRIGTRILVPVEELRLWLAKESYESK